MRLLLVGSPNCGKTTLFNALTGEHQRVGNWPGVTVEKKIGIFTSEHVSFELIDLPGIYSLTSSSDASQDEQIAATTVASRDFDCIINVMDACHFERHLYLTSQLLELGVPVVIALNMMDLARSKGIHLSIEALVLKLNCSVIALEAHRGMGVLELKQCLSASLSTPKPLPLPLSSQMIEALTQLETKLAGVFCPEALTYAVRRVAEGDMLLLLHQMKNPFVSDSADSLDLLMADARYTAVHALARAIQTKTSDTSNQWTARIDRIVLHRFFAFPLFFAMMYALFFFAIHIGGAFQDFFDITTEALFVQLPASLMYQAHLPNWLIAWIANGIGRGINTTFTFIPVMASMYFFLALLEASGYMARAAFVVDKVMRYIGLPGKSFVPMIVGFGCNVPSVMSARMLDSERDRLLTILMSPFMSCSARLAIYAVFVAAFFPEGGQNIVFSLYMIGILMAVLTGFLLRRTLFQGQNSVLILELPVYHRPSLRRLLRETGYRLRLFIVRAGKLIIPVCAVLGALNTYAMGGSIAYEGTGSILSWFGQHLTPLFSPMGISNDNWPAAVGLMTGVLAKEVVIGTLNGLYANMAHLTATIGDFNLWASLTAALMSIVDNFSILTWSIVHPMSHALVTSEMTQSVYGVMVQQFDGKIGAYAYLLFVLLYIPCVSTIVVIRQEAKRKLMWFSILWSTMVAYITATLFYQIATFNRHPKQTILWALGIAMFLLIASRFIRPKSDISEVVHAPAAS
jgi:ferrous iron transport protein B